MKGRSIVEKRNVTERDEKEVGESLQKAESRDLRNMGSEKAM
jgi:hypothetical protein